MTGVQTCALPIYDGFLLLLLLFDVLLGLQERFDVALDLFERNGRAFGLQGVAADDVISELRFDRLGRNFARLEREGRLFEFRNHLALAEGAERTAAGAARAGAVLFGELFEELRILLELLQQRGSLLLRLLVGGIILAVGGDQDVEARISSSVILVNKVDAPNPDYAMDNRKNVTNWFEIGRAHV